MKTDGAETLPYARLPYLRLIPVSFRGRSAPVGIRPHFMSTAAKGRHLPLPLRGKGAI